MGRLSTIIDAAMIIACAAAVGCDDNKPKVTVTNERSQAILGSPSAATPSPVPKPSDVSIPAIAKVPRKLCGGRLGKAGPELPTDQPLRRSATGERDLPEQVSTVGHYTWINFWAAWCGPCKEEIPRLQAWEKKLTAARVAFKVVFVSLDDDERQLLTFLEKQPQTGLRSTYWLPDGAKRTDWLKPLNVKPDAELPVQLLLDKAGHVRCTVGGAIDDADFEQLRGLLNGTE
jgi:thiol-disulfide isomerase/thioredoxin